MRFLSSPHRKRGLVLVLLLTSVIWSSRVDAASFQLTWTDASSNEGGFKIERSTGSAFAVIATVGANVASYTDSSASAGNTYCYRVRAFNSYGTSDPSNEACANAPDSGTTTISLDGSGTLPDSDSTWQTGSGSISSSTSQAGDIWADYRVSLKIKSTDNDAIGVMFRYVDSDNYYRFSWYHEKNARRLEKFKDGVRTVLAEDAAGYAGGRTYKVQISAQEATLKVWVDGALIFSVVDSSFDAGTVALYSWYNAGSIFDDLLVEDLLTGETLLWEDFNDGKADDWVIVDQGGHYAPSRWEVSNGTLVQSSNIGSSASHGLYLGTYALYTYALYTKKNWADYRVSLKIKSADNDAIGVMFRYQDDENYYRFSWDNDERKSRRLEKFVNGRFRTLAEDSVSYKKGQTYEVEIVADGAQLEVKIDGNSIFSAVDSSFSTGTVALYSWYNKGSVFDDVLVQDLSSGATLVWEDFNDGKADGWVIVDEGGHYAPSRWEVSNGTLVQSSNIGSSASHELYLGTYALYTY